MPLTRQQLQQRAKEHWPDNPTMQTKWLAAIAKLRTTGRGWILETRMEKQDARTQYRAVS